MKNNYLGNQKAFGTTKTVQFSSFQAGGVVNGVVEW